MEKLFNALGGRKMFLALMLFIIATILLIMNTAQFSEWAEFIKWVFGIFALGNAGEHLAKRGS